MSKQHKILRRTAATFLATAMMASLTAVPALAVEGEEDVITSLPITKVVTTDGDTYAPATTFTFTVTNGDAAEDFDDGTNTVDVTAGVTGGLTGTTIASSPNTDASTSTSYTFSGSLGVDLSKFGEPGVYHYVVGETAGSYEGITYSTESYDVYVYVVNGTDGLEVDAVIAFKDGEKQDSVVFTNNYGAGENDSTHDVVITKNVEGTLANMSDTFSFDIKVNGAEGEVYKVVYTQNKVPVTTHVSSGDDGITVSGIGDEDTITIYGLSENDTYTVTETDGVSQGYTVTDTVSSDAAGTVSGKVTEDRTVESITNTKDASTPTGIIRDIAPYALLVVAAAGACVIFLRKRTAE